MILVGICGCKRTYGEQHLTACRLRDYMLERFAGEKSPSQRILLTGSGKPYLDGGAPFSVSHSETAVCCGIFCSDETRIDSCVNEKLPYFELIPFPGPRRCKAIGVDIELIKTSGTDNILRIAQRRFFEKEREYVSGGDGKEFSSRFFEVWTAKESYCKCTGRGLADLASFDLFGNHDGYDIIGRRILSAEGEYALSVCTTG